MFIYIDNQKKNKRQYLLDKIKSFSERSLNLARIKFYYGNI